MLKVFREVGGVSGEGSAATPVNVRAQNFPTPTPRPPPRRGGGRAMLGAQLGHRMVGPAMFKRGADRCVHRSPSRIAFAFAIRESSGPERCGAADRGCTGSRARPPITTRNDLTTICKTSIMQTVIR